MLHPLFLKLEGRRVLVVGAGSVAQRKIEDLATCGATVDVVAPEATVAVRALHERGAVRWQARAFTETDADKAWLVLAATSDPEVQHCVSCAAEARNIFCVAIDDPCNGSAFGAALVRRAPFTIAISSDGELPALSRLLREVLEQALPDKGWVEAARELRTRWRAQHTPIQSRFDELVRTFKARAG